jgi:hypothetical protein
MVTSTSTYHGRELQRAVLSPLGGNMVFFVLKNNEMLQNYGVICPNRYVELNREVSQLNWYAQYEDDFEHHSGGIELGGMYGFPYEEVGYHAVDEFYIHNDGRIYIHFDGYLGFGCPPPRELIAGHDGWFYVPHIVDNVFRRRPEDIIIQEEEGYAEYKNRKEFFLKY